MIYISHRGNLTGPSNEGNNPSRINHAISLGYDVEIDLFKIGRELYLGHDEPKYQVKEYFLKLNKDRLWIHAKNPDALDYISAVKGYNYFYHQQDDYAFTSKGFIIVMPGQVPIPGSIYMKPEFGNANCIQANCAGICSDYICEYV